MAKDDKVISRRDQHLECSQLVGQLNVKLSDGSLEFIGVYCTKPKGHRDGCEFVGVELVITRRRREDGQSGLYLPGHRHE
jgi:hypothetical protein